MQEQNIQHWRSRLWNAVGFGIDIRRAARIGALTVRVCVRRRTYPEHECDLARPPRMADSPARSAADGLFCSFRPEAVSVDGAPLAGHHKGVRVAFSFTAADAGLHGVS